MKTTFRTALPLAVSLAISLLGFIPDASAAGDAAAQPWLQKQLEGLTPGGDKPIDLHNGAFQHGINVEVPAFHGLQPSVGLSFNSAGGNGFAGLGWSLTGFSVIERVGATGSGTRRCAADDAYTLDGEPLVACTALGGTYCTKSQSFRRIQFDSAGQRWTIWNKDGTKLTYTKTFQIPASLPNSSCPYRYGLASAEDTSGNKVTYTWFDDMSVGENHKELYPASISYNGVTITFYRELRPDLISYANGFDWTNQQYRLKAIAVTVNAAGPANNGAVQLARAYKLGYATTAGGRSALASVALYGRDATVDAAGTITGGASGALWQQTFSYAGGSVGFGAGGSQSDSGFSDAMGWSDVTNYSTIKQADIDGDGRMDFCGRGDTGIVCGRQNGAGWSGPPEFKGPAWSDANSWNKPQYYSTIQFPDINGDGRADLCGRAAAGVVCLLNLASNPGFKTTGPTRTGMGNASGWDKPQYYSTIQFPDINGDGKADLCGRDSHGVQCSITNPDGTSFGSAFYGPLWSNAAGWDLPEHYSTIQFPDINGDGKADVCGRSSDGIRCYLSTGSGFDLGVTWIGPAWSDANGWTQAMYYSTIQYPDINGDGKADVCARASDGIRCHLAIGSARIPGDVTAYAFNTIAIQSTSGQTDANGYGSPQYYSTIQYPDINGDGRADVCWRDSHGINCDRSNGTSFTNAFRAALGWTNVNGWSDADNYSTIRFPDLDGDGKADIFARANAGLVAYLTNHDGPERLTGITNNGCGGSVQLTYTPSSAFPNTNNPPIEQVVTAMAVGDGRGHTATASISYSGGQFDRAAKRSLGFRYVKRTLPAIAGETAPPIEETWFMQAPYACTGQVDFVKKSDGLGRLLLFSERTYEPLGGGAGPFTCNLDQQSDIVYDVTSGSTTCDATDNAHCKRKDVNYDYDAYGNVTVSYDYGDYFDASDDVTRQTTYNLNTGAFIVNAAMTARAYAGIGTTGALLTERRSYYDSAAALATPPTRGLATRQEDWVSNTGGYVARAKGYDAAGNLVSEDDALGNRTRYVYDPIFKTFRISATNPLGHTTATDWDTVCGQPNKETGPDGQLTQTQYDAFCRLDRRDGPLGGFEQHVYGPLGNATTQFERVESPPVAGIAGNVYKITYLDGFKRAYRTQERGPDPAIADDALVDSEYDVRGNLGTQTLPHREGTSGATVTHDYDALDRPIRVTQADGASSTINYSLWTTTFNDETLKSTARTLDAHDRLVSVAERDGRDWQVVTYAYDLRGNLVRTVDPAGNTTSYDFNSLGQKLAQNDPDLGASTYAYDPNGNLVSTTDARGQRTDTGYDAAGRAVSKTFGAQSETPDTVTFRYDERRAGYFNTSQMTTMIDGSGSTTLDYDAAGQVLREVRMLDGTLYTTLHAYDPAGRLVGTTFPDGETVGDDPRTPMGESPVAYDAAGRLRALPGFVNAISYGAAGEVAQIANANGTTTTRGYSPTRNWLDTLRTTLGATSIQDLTYARDARGRIKTLTSAVAGSASWTFGYDSWGRLTSAAQPGVPALNQDFSYDRLGNMLSNSRVGLYTYPPAGGGRPHAVVFAADRALTYDATGNMVSGNGRSYEWDLANRLARVARGSDVTTFTYDGKGARVKQTVNGAVTRYIDDDYEIGADGVPVKYFRIAGTLVAKKVGGQRFWLHTDHLGSISAITDQAGAVVKGEQYLAYGQVFDSTGTQPESFGFTGQRSDGTGLLFLNARYYDPEIGRFLSPDSETPGDVIVSLNRYAYSFNDPVNHIDPSGHWPSWVNWSAVGKFATVAVVGLAATAVCGPLCGAGAVFAVGTAWDIGEAAIDDNKDWHPVESLTENGIDAAATLVCAGLCGKLGEKAGGLAGRPLLGRVAGADGLYSGYWRWGVYQQGMSPKTATSVFAGYRWAGDGYYFGGKATEKFVEANVEHAASQPIKKAFSWLLPEQGEVQMMFKKIQRPSGPVVAPNPYYTPPKPVVIPPNPYYNGPRPASHGSGGCFVAGTRVTMADGTQQPIDQVRVGERVLAFDEATGALVAAPVTEVYVHPDWSRRAETVLVNGRLRATGNHPFYVNGGWRRADQIRPGDLLRELTPLMMDGGPNRSTASEAVSSVAVLPGADTVYNLEVDRYHTYFAEGVLVHNMKTLE